MAYGGQILGTNEILFFFLKKKKIILEIGKKNQTKSGCI